MSTQRFQATLSRAGSRTFILLPFDPDEVWGAKQRHHVSGSVNGHTIRGPLDFEGTRWVLPLGAAWRRDNGLEAGADVEVILAPEGPQLSQLAPDIAAALEAAPEAKAFFESLATFYRTGYVNWIESARRAPTRAARIAEMVELLAMGRKQK